VVRSFFSFFVRAKSGRTAVRLRPFISHYVAACVCHRTRRHAHTRAGYPFRKDDHVDDDVDDHADDEDGDEENDAFIRSR